MWAFLSFLILVPWIAYTQITFFSGYESKEDTALVQRLAKALLATESIYLKDHIPGDWDIVCLTPYYYKAIDLPPPNIRNIEEFEIDRFDINENEKYKKIVLYNLKNKKIHFYNINNRQMIIDRAIVETDCVEFQTSTLRKNTKAYNAYSYIWE